MYECVCANHVSLPCSIALFLFVQRGLATTTLEAYAVVAAAGVPRDNAVSPLHDEGVRSTSVCTPPTPLFVPLTVPVQCTAGLIMYCCGARMLIVVRLFRRFSHTVTVVWVIACVSCISGMFVHMCTYCFCACVVRFPLS